MFKVGDRVIIAGEFPVWSVSRIDYTTNKIEIIRYYGGNRYSQSLDLDWAFDRNLRIASESEVSKRDIEAIILNKKRDIAEAEEKLNRKKTGANAIKNFERNMFNDMTHELLEPKRTKKEEKPKEVKPLKRSIEF